MCSLSSKLILFVCIYISFNLMAVVPDRRIAITHKLKMLKTNKVIVTAALEKLLLSTVKAEEQRPNTTKSETGNDTHLEERLNVATLSLTGDLETKKDDVFMASVLFNLFSHKRRNDINDVTVGRMQYTRSPRR